MFCPDMNISHPDCSPVIGDLWKGQLDWLVPVFKLRANAVTRKNTLLLRHALLFLCFEGFSQQSPLNKIFYFGGNVISCRGGGTVL